MKQTNIRIFSLLLAVLMVFSMVPQAMAAPTGPADNKIYTDPTGYDSADDVVYKVVSGTVANWGARGENCTFLTTYASSFYTGSYTYAALSQMDGSKYQNDVPNTELYKALQTLMKSNHKNVQSYNATRDYYKYTDCLKNETSKLSTFYTGKLVNSAWDGGKTYNREHCWPSSKCINTSKKEDGADIMMLRPENPNDNSSRGNKGYGLGAAFFDPGVSVHGDCARLLLYGYVRWGNTGKMWGSNGVIENINILFQWMEEDPVDTWEMGRNDAVESITGTRNVFVDYPELAYILFDRAMPANMTTPSGNAGNGNYTPPACQHDRTEVRGAKAATCTEPGYTGDTVCQECGTKMASGNTIPATGHKDENDDLKCDVCGSAVDCLHKETEVIDAKEPTCSEEGYTGDTCCKRCGEIITAGEAIPATGQHTEEIVDAKEATCCEDGATGTTVCADCGEILKAAGRIPATGEHTFGDWVVTREPTATEPGTKEHICTVGGFKETEEIPAGSVTETTDPTDPTKPDNNGGSSDTPAQEPSSLIWIIVAVVVALGGGAVAVILILKKKKK